MQDGKLELTRDDDGFVTLLLEDPGSSALVLSGKLIDLLAEALDRLEAMADVAGLILASACPRVFIAGANLKEIDSLSDADLDAYLKRGSDTFARLARLPYPTVAAIDGAALGGGLEIALHCDGLVALRKDKPYPVGLPEAGLAICPGWGGTQLLPARIEPKHALEQTAAGKPMKFDEAEIAGLFDAVANHPDMLTKTATDWLGAAASGGLVQQRISRKTPLCVSWHGKEAAHQALEDVQDAIGVTDSGRAVANAVRIGLANGYEAGVDAERAALIELRSRPAARERLEAFFSKSK